MRLKKVQKDVVVVFAMHGMKIKFCLKGWGGLLSSSGLKLEELR